MIEFKKYISEINDEIIKNRFEEILSYITNNYPNLERRIAWNQPMFTNDGTFIIGFSYAKNHIAIAPELVTINHFSEKVKSLGLNHTKMLIQLPHNKEIPFNLIKEIIDFNIKEKEGYQTFWRK